MTADSTFSFDYLQRIWTLRFFWYSLVCNDIRSRYRRSILGVGWSLLRPLCMTAILCVVFGTLFKRDLATFAPFVLVGMMTWQFIAESLGSGCHCFVSGSAYIRQQKIPHAIFPLRTILSSGFHFAVAFALGIVITALIKGIPSPAHLAFLPISMVIIALLGWSLAIIAGVAQTHFPDTSHLLEISLQIMFYLSPIMYEPSDFKDRHFGVVLALNPVTSILELFRKPLLHGELPSLFAIAMSLGFTLTAALLAWFLLRRLERTLVYWL